jgi:hypothetical protein
VRPAVERRNGNYLGRHPATTRVTHQPVDLSAHASFAAGLREIPPQRR